MKTLLFKSCFLLCCWMLQGGFFVCFSVRAQTAAMGELPSSSTALVPRIDLHFVDGNNLDSVHAHKSLYYAVTVRIDGGGGYPDLTATAAQIRGRGNSTWNYIKKPYRIKFDKKTSVLGLTAAKNWVLLANYQYNAHLSGAIAMKAHQMVGGSSAHHIIPVELYVDSVYVGLYNLSEHVSMSDASVRIAAEKEAALLELDTNYDETYKFKDDVFALPVMVKDPDVSKFKTLAERSHYMNTLTARFNQLTHAVRNDTTGVDRLIDTTSLARFLFVHELIGNQEINHPKSIFMYTTRVASADSLWRFGPFWDADWAYGYEQNRAYGTVDPQYSIFDTPMQGKGTLFFSHLLRNSPGTLRELQRLFTRFSQTEDSQILGNYIDQFMRFTSAALHREYQRWHNMDRNYAQVADGLKSWLQQRVEFLNTYYQNYPPTPEEDDKAITALSRVSADFGNNPLEQYPATTGVYALDGRKVATLAQLRKHPLPAGIYLVGTKKIIFY